MENATQKFTSREYSVPVQAANEMAERLRFGVICRYDEQSSKYLMEYNREKTKTFESLKRISEKTIDFDLDNFRKERKRLLKPPPPPDILVPKKILQAVPANCVLDFGPGNSILYYGGEHFKKGVIARNSVITNPRKRNLNRPRPFTAIPLSIRQPNSALNRSGRNTSLGIVGNSGRLSSLDFASPSGRNQSQIFPVGLQRTESLIDNKNEIDEESSHIEYNHKSSHKWQMPNRSFRQLKKLYTYTEEQKPDLTAERFKMMKNRENVYFKYLDDKVKEFHV
ncbi:Hypothetical predicted protein [Mytilus galloprovincialis]|uniref:Uncharacterized protein n=1 Tax=Mytilus galloprovincialis TaxID=29158 RepID=A0A8B6BIG9_MYTGA|nr:Hypothetical predicted protein [Mytilus galloprovincialis]